MNEDKKEKKTSEKITDQSPLTEDRRSLWSRWVFTVIAIGSISVVLFGAVVGMYLLSLSATLPQLATAEDYQPRLVSEVFDVNGQKIGEFFREKRKIVALKDVPPQLLQSFLVAEDSSFYEHRGINYLAILRAFWVNLKEGRKVQGGSTITQQVARSLLLTPEKTYTRKLKEILLAYRMESRFSKEEIFYLYLNQIYLGSGAYGVVAAAEIYFRKSLQELTLEEMALLAGLPQAPSRYSPIINPKAAKNRQRYVLSRMEEQGFISKGEKEEALQKEVKVYFRKGYQELAPYYVETVRQELVKNLGQDVVLDQGIQIHTAMDLDKQIMAQNSLKLGLRSIDKRQGYRGAKDNLQDSEQIEEFLLQARNQLMDDKNPSHIIDADGEVAQKPPLNLEATNIPDYIEEGDIIDGIVTDVDDQLGLVTVRFAEGQGLINIESMKWAASPDPDKHWRYREINKPSQALKVGDVIEVKVVDAVFPSPSQRQKKASQKYDFATFALLELEQEPLVQGALISFDLKTENIIAMVGGRDFQLSKFNRAIQALRQSGSSFKPIIYLSALDKGFKPNSIITDSPIVYKEESMSEDGETETMTWKPGNYASQFEGDTLLRNALKQSKNIPTVKLLEDVGIEWASQYAKRLGIFHPLNMDLSLGLGSSSVTLYEMTKVFGHFARLGQKLSPLLIQNVKDKSGEDILDTIVMDQRFADQLTELESAFEVQRMKFLNPLYEDYDTAEYNGVLSVEDDIRQPGSDVTERAEQPLIFFEDAQQLIGPQTAYLMTSLLKAVVEEPGGTGARAKNLGRTSAGKTGTTSGYFDAWYVGYTPQVVTGVWVGFDDEKTLGRGETGSSAALPIWLEYMKQVHEDLPEEDFAVPDQIVFANIDNETGYLASASSKDVVMQAFLEGTQPTSNTEESVLLEGGQLVDFYRKDLSE